MGCGAYRPDLWHCRAGQRTFPQGSDSGAARQKLARVLATDRAVPAASARGWGGRALVQRAAADGLSGCDLCAVSVGDLDGTGDVPLVHIGISGDGDVAGRATVGADD